MFRFRPGLRFAVLAVSAASAGCGVKYIIEQPQDLRRVCSATAVPIANGKSQEEYRTIYFTGFRDAFRKFFDGKLRIVDWQGEKGLNWEEAVEAGKALGVDAVVGILIDDSSYPPRRMEIVKVAKVSSGRVIARQNRLIPPDERYGFHAELGDLRKLLQCVPANER